MNRIKLSSILFLIFLSVGCAQGQQAPTKFTAGQQIGIPVPREYEGSPPPVLIEKKPEKTVLPDYRLPGDKTQPIKPVPPAYKEPIVQPEKPVPPPYELPPSGTQFQGPEK